LNTLLLFQRYSSFKDPLSDGIGIVMRMAGGWSKEIIRDDDDKTRTESDVT
jgi:hypothetical protein